MLTLYSNKLCILTLSFFLWKTCIKLCIGRILYAAKNLFSIAHEQTIIRRQTSSSSSVLLRIVVRTSIFRRMNTALAVCEQMSFAKSLQEKGCSSQAKTKYIDERYILMKDFD